MATPSSVTSKRPPLEGMSRTSAPANFFLISTARLAARGSYFQTEQYSIVIFIGESLRVGRVSLLTALRRRDPRHLFRRHSDPGQVREDTNEAVLLIHLRAQRVHLSLQISGLIAERHQFVLRIENRLRGVHGRRRSRAGHACGRRAEGRNGDEQDRCQPMLTARWPRQADRASEPPRCERTKVVSHPWWWLLVYGERTEANTAAARARTLCDESLETVAARAARARSSSTRFASSSMASSRPRTSLSCCN